MLTRAQKDKAFQADCIARAAVDFEWWCDSFAWTYSPKDFPNRPVRPFIVRGYQGEELLYLHGAIGKHHVLWEKSRDMGLTVQTLAYFEWRSTFMPNQSFLLTSRKEDLVDKTGDPGSLFAKMDFLRGKLPGWLRPKVDRLKMHCLYLHSGSVCDGEATSGDMGRGDRRTAILADEFATNDDGDQASASMQHATNTVIYISTHQGSHTTFNHLAVKFRALGYTRRIHWTAHPDKARGLYYHEGKPRSPWYDEQEATAPSRQWLAQEVDIDVQGSAFQFFEAEKITELVKRDARKPYAIGLLEFDATDVKRQSTFLKQPEGPLWLWCELDEVGDPPRAKYVITADVATGKAGEKSSSSTAAVYDEQTGEKKAEYSANNIYPPDYARFLAALSWWFSDDAGRPALLCHEDGGPGGEVSAELEIIGGLNLFYRDDRAREQKKPGFSTNRATKRPTLTAYFAGLMRGEITNRSERALLECGEFVHGEDGSIFHAGSKSKDPTESGENHGDLVTADGIAYFILGPKIRKQNIQPAEPLVKPGSIAWRRMERDRSKANTYAW